MPRVKMMRGERTSHPKKNYDTFSSWPDGHSTAFVGAKRMAHLIHSTKIPKGQGKVQIRAGGVRHVKQVWVVEAGRTEM